MMMTSRTQAPIDPGWVDHPQDLVEEVRAVVDDLVPQGLE